MTRRAWLLLALVIAATGAAWWSRPTRWEHRFDAPGAKLVLFVGNSQTYVNDVPALVAQLADAAGEAPLGYHAVVAGGAELRDHLERGTFQAALAERRWDVVVLQEQGTLQGTPSRRETDFLPAATAMVALAGPETDARLVQFWAYAPGDPEHFPEDTNGAMRARIRDNVRAVADATGAAVIPSGDAATIVLAGHPEIALWSPDGIHASLAGSYLSACVHFAALYGRPVTGVPFTADLPPEVVVVLQAASDQAVAAKLPR